MLLKGAGMNGIDCKGIPQDQFGWIPKLNAWLGWNREPSHPGDALHEFDKLNVTLAISWKRGLTFTFEKGNDVTNLTLNSGLNEKV